MTRTVKVGLEADVAAYLAPIKEAGKATETLDRHVEALDHDLGELERDSVKAAAGVAVLDAAAKKAKDDVSGLGKETENLDGKSKKATDSQEKLGGKAKQAADSFKLLGTSVSDAGTHIDGLGKNSSALDVIDARLKSLGEEAKKLGEEFLHTGSTSVFDKIGKNSGDQDALKKLRKTVSEALGEGAQEAGMLEKFGTSVSGVLPEALSNPAVLAGVVAAGAVIGTTLVAAVGGAITAGAGATVVGLGIAGAIMGNPEAFATEWSSAIQHVKKDWIDASAPFVGPTLDAIRSVGPLVDSWHLDSTFAKAATYVKPLTAGVEGFATFVEAGVDALVQRAGPVVNALAAVLPELGADIQDALESIAENSGGGAAALHDVVGMLGTAIAITGFWIGQLEQTYGVFDTLGQHVTQFFNEYRVGLDIATFGAAELQRYLLNTWNSDNVNHYGAALEGAKGSIDETGHAVSNAADKFAELQKQLNATSVTADSLAASMVKKLFDGIMGLDQATLSWNESLTRISESLKTNGKGLDIHTAKGQANRESILAAVTANMQLYQAQMSAGAKAEDAAADYDANTAALERQLRKAHLTQGEIDGLIGKYRGIPARVDTNIAMEGLTNAINDLDDLIRYINHIPARKDVYIYTHTGTVGGKEGPAFYAHGGIRKAATGLLVPPSDPGSVLFGEPSTGGEAFIPLKGISPSRAMDLAQTVGNNYGFDAIPRGWPGNGAQRVAVQVSVGVAPGGDSAVGTMVNNLIRNGVVVVKASQVRPGV